MRIIAKRILFEQAAHHADSVEAINNWYRRVRKASWRSLTDVQADYPHADLVGDRTVFNIRGNHYRLIVHIRYDLQIVYIKHLLTHAEYDKGAWTNE